MPLYEYKCQGCDRVFELMQKMADPDPECPKCKGKTERQLGAPQVQLKGGGWYADGYQKK